MPFKVVRSSKKIFDAQRVVQQTGAALNDFGEFACNMFDTTTQFWNNPPSFRKIIRIKRGSEFKLVVVPDGNIDAVAHWSWANDGREFHHDFMTEDFIPKTPISGGFGTNSPGQGGYAYTDNKNYHIINPRAWTSTFLIEQDDVFLAYMQSAIRTSINE